MQGWACPRRYFNPRSPHGERRLSIAVVVPVPLFQPTLPARGATHRQRRKHTRDAYFNPRSPHGERRTYAAMPVLRRYFNPRSPHGERPFAISTNGRGGYNFNPRSPHGERRQGWRTWSPEENISTHAPRTGSDLHQERFYRPRCISTHAPRTGSDGCPPCPIAVACDFNPRSPHGERPSSACPSGTSKRISTHAPRTGSDEMAKLLRQNGVISTHAPRTGSDVGKGAD